jgi:hypothetical protein
VKNDQIERKKARYQSIAPEVAGREDVVVDGESGGGTSESVRAILIDFLSQIMI